MESYCGLELTSSHPKYVHPCTYSVAGMKNACTKLFFSSKVFWSIANVLFCAYFASAVSTLALIVTGVTCSRVICIQSSQLL